MRAIAKDKQKMKELAEVTPEDALEDQAKEADLLKHKIKGMDTSIKLLMKQVAENNAKDKTITKKKQKELTDEQKRQGDPGNDSLRLHATVLRPDGLVQDCEN